jgi:hypothetical protein
LQTNIGDILNLQELKASQMDGPGQGFAGSTSKFLFLYPGRDLPLLVSKRDRKYGFFKTIAAWVLCGVTAVSFFVHPIPAMLLRSPLAWPFCPLLWNQPIV